jgi:hypothetical protein
MSITTTAAALLSFDEASAMRTMLPSTNTASALTRSGAGRASSYQPPEHKAKPAEDALPARIIGAVPAPSTDAGHFEGSLADSKRRLDPISPSASSIPGGSWPCASSPTAKLSSPFCADGAPRRLRMMTKLPPLRVTRATVTKNTVATC